MKKCPPTRPHALGADRYKPLFRSCGIVSLRWVGFLCNWGDVLLPPLYLPCFLIVRMRGIPVWKEWWCPLILCSTVVSWWLVVREGCLIGGAVFWCLQVWRIVFLRRSLVCCNLMVSLLVLGWGGVGIFEVPGLYSSALRPWNVYTGNSNLFSIPGIFFWSSPLWWCIFTVAD